jgi:hypothetical protein
MIFERYSLGGLVQQGDRKTIGLRPSLSYL